MGIQSYVIETKGSVNKKRSIQGAGRAFKAWKKKGKNKKKKKKATSNKLQAASCKRLKKDTIEMI